MILGEIVEYVRGLQELLTLYRSERAVSSERVCKVIFLLEDRFSSLTFCAQGPKPGAWCRPIHMTGAALLYGQLDLAVNMYRDPKSRCGPEHPGHALAFRELDRLLHRCKEYVRLYVQGTE